MKVRELGDAINMLSEVELELEVRIDADHGQSAMAANFAGLGFVAEDEYMGEQVDPEDAEDYHISVFMITD